MSSRFCILVEKQVDRCIGMKKRERNPRSRSLFNIESLKLLIYFRYLLKKSTRRRYSVSTFARFEVP